MALGYASAEKEPEPLQLESEESAAARQSLPLTGELCYLLGRWLANGTILRQNGTGRIEGLQLSFALTEREPAAAIAAIAEKLTGRSPLIEEQSEPPRYRLQLLAPALARYCERTFGSYPYQRRLPAWAQTLPPALASQLLHGLFEAAGQFVSGQVSLVLSSRALALQLQQLLLRLGSPFALELLATQGSERYRLTAPLGVCTALGELASWLDRCPANLSSEAAVGRPIEYEGLIWTPVTAIAIEDYSGPVLDIEVEEDHSFIAGGLVISNCYVIPSPEDSRQGILDNLKIMTEIMARGGGVGINLSTLRPRGSYIKTVNGTASGPCSWAQLYSVATGDVIQQGGSRRGALMLMLDDTHPDVEEFITVKRTEGKIEHANLSVCISDRFMQAVKNDEPWDLVWQGEVKKTVRARDLWDLICKSAWESAEPGVVFMDRCNKEANTWYYEKINCVNPCVTGDTLIYTGAGLIPARELAQNGLPVPIVSQEPSRAAAALVGSARRVEIGQRGTALASLRSPLRLASPVFPTGVKPVYRLRTREGYSLRLTADHRLLTTDGWKAAAELRPGERLHLLRHGGAFGTEGSAELGQALAWWTARANGLEVPAPDPELSEATLAQAEALCAAEAEAACSQRLPAAILRGRQAMQRGFLATLFSLAGSLACDRQGGSVLLLSGCPRSLLEDIQRLLLNFAILSEIRPQPQSQPGGSGDALCISGCHLRRFSDQIGLLPASRQRILSVALSQSASEGEPEPEEYLATFESLEPDGEELVYDLVEPQMHLFIANGLVVHNCGEQPLPPWGVCNLGALNLAAFVKDGEMDYQQLAEIARVAMRFLDNVIDANEYFIEENRQAQLATRRTGLGTMGLADALIKMKIPYGSDRSIPVIERIYRTIRDAAYDASADIAAEKGPFPRFEREKYMQGRFIQRLPRQIQDKIRKQGIRNAVLLTQAPTGTTSLFAGVSSGIEPVYDFAMVRRDRTGEHVLYHPLFKAWRDEHPGEPTPDYFVAANDLTPEQHVRVQATIQKYTDASISKTVNAPNSHTVEDVKKLYTLAYELGCKGITYMRDGSRVGVLSHIEEKKSEQQHPQPAQSASATPAGQDQQSAHSEGRAEPGVNQGPMIKPPPEVLHGYTRKIRAPEGKVNVTINSDEHGPLEVFVNVGKAGSDILALAEALGRLISLILRIPSPLSQVDRMREVAEQLRGIAGSRSVGFGIQQIRSLPDAVARALELHLEMLESGSNTPASLDRQPQSESHNNSGPGESLQIGYLNVTGNLCPQCGCNTMVYEEGCRKCYSCGYSEC
ncbi:LAGLIDADG family homing endonuclease [Thermogemmatispora sp.]|uniref:TSCPD domain-containing protein n=1 Tax=Thermogemmatispora sp. TaxID=1968838 RepID=UPI0035E44DB0